MKVVLDDQELAWSTRQCYKMYQKFKNLPPKEQRIKARERDAFSKLFDKLAAATPPQEINMTRTEAKLLQDVAIEQLANLLMKAIPEYERRVEKDYSLQRYIDKANELAEGLRGLIQKIETAL